MKKIFEFILIIIIFYGVYTAFSQAAPILFHQPKALWVGIASFVASGALLLLYSFIIRSDVKIKMKEDITKLEELVKEKEALVVEKEQEVQKAQSFKDNLIKEAEEAPFTE